MWSKNNTNKVMLILLALIIIIVPMLSFWYFYKTDNDSTFEPYFDSYSETSEKLATSLFNGSQYVIDQITDPLNWDDDNVSYYQDQETGEIDYGITFQAIPLVIDFPDMLSKHNGGYLVAKYTQYGNVRYNINPKRIDVDYSPFDKDAVHWMSPTTLLYNGYTVFVSNYPFGTSTAYSFSGQFGSTSIDLKDTMYNYDLVYNTSNHSNVYTRGFQDKLIYEDYGTAFLLGNQSNVKNYQVPTNSLLKNYDWSNYKDLPNVLLLENPNDVNDLYVVDLTDSSAPIYYRTIEDYENGVNSESVHIETVYDFMEIFGIDDLMSSIVDYLKSFPRVVMAMYGVEELMFEMLLSEKLAQYISLKLLNIAKNQIEDVVISRLHDKFNNLSEEQQNEIIKFFDDLNLSELNPAAKDWIIEWGKNNWSSLVNSTSDLVLNVINTYFQNNFNEIIDEVNNTSRATTIQYVNMLQNEYSDAKSNVSLIETQQKIYEKVILKSMIETIPGQYLEDIIDNPEFELSIEIQDDIIYFYTNSDRSEYFGYDIYSQTIFTPEVKGMHKH